LQVVDLQAQFKNTGEVVLAVFFIGECDFDLMGVDLSGRNFAKTIAKDSGDATTHIVANLTDVANKPNLSAGWWS
jgi:hypothetical protein